MAALLGRFLFWLATIIASVLVVWVVWGYVYTSNRGEPIISIVPLLLAGVIWLAGWVCRKVFAER
jgi:drug/metabolite transporter (DMT)-like permease